MIVVERQSRDQIERARRSLFTDPIARGRVTARAARTLRRNTAPQ
jgi:hypothetical protein